MSARAVPLNVDDPGDGSPSLDELEQREEHAELPIPAVPVHVDGPVQTQELPPRTSVVRSMTVTTEPQELLPADLRRSRALVWAIDGAVYVGKTSNDCRPSTPGAPAPGARLPQTTTPVELRGFSRLWVAAVAPGPVLVTVIAESWAD